MSVEINSDLRNVCYVVSNELVKYSSLLPSNPKRSLLVHSLVKAYGLLEPAARESKLRLQILRPIPADFRDLSVYHSRDYLDLVLNPENMSTSVPDSDGLHNVEYGLEEDCPPFVGLPEYVRLVAGASLAAADALRTGHADIAICWDGGRHHAYKSKASGFCYVADCVLAILALKRSQPSQSLPSRKTRIMYLDLDLHFSDAVSQAFSSSANTSGVSQVLTLSVHHSAPGFFPISELSSLPDPSNPLLDPFTLSLPLCRGASDATFARIWHCVEGVKDAFQPDVVVVQCGVDGLAGDPNGIWNWSLGGSDGSLGWCIQNVCHTWNCKVLLLGGGGYNSANAARAWTYLTAIAMREPLPLDADIPDHSAFPLYAPSFTLDVPPGNAQDQNSAEYLQEVDGCFKRVTEVIRERISFTGENRARVHDL